MRRRVFNLAAAVSLVLCPLLLFFWWRSSIVLDQLTLSKDRQYFLTSHLGRVTVGWSSCDNGALIFYPTGGVGVRSVAPGVYAATWTLRWNNAETEDQSVFEDSGEYFMNTWGYPFGRKPRVHHVVAIGAGYWLLMSVAAAAPASWVARWLIGWLRQKRGLCPTCGYDLRATPERCPECGLRRAQSSRAEAKPQPAEGAAA